MKQIGEGYWWWVDLGWLPTEVLSNPVQRDEGETKVEKLLGQDKKKTGRSCINHCHRQNGLDLRKTKLLQSNRAGWCEAEANRLLPALSSVLASHLQSQLLWFTQPWGGLNRTEPALSSLGSPPGLAEAPGHGHLGQKPTEQEKQPGLGDQLL